MVRKKIEPHPCMDCARAKLIQYSKDPIIAQCEVDGELNVASTNLTCYNFKQRTTPAEIIHRKKRITITDKYYD